MRRSFIGDQEITQSIIILKFGRVWGMCPAIFNLFSRRVSAKKCRSKNVIHNCLTSSSSSTSSTKPVCSLQYGHTSRPPPPPASVSAHNAQRRCPHAVRTARTSEAQWSEASVKHTPHARENASDATAADLLMFIFNGQDGSIVEIRDQRSPLTWSHQPLSASRCGSPA